MRIQITNDDGIESTGLHVLAARLAETGHEIIVVAPDRDWSGAGAALGTIRPDEHLKVARVTIDLAPGVEAWALDGPPALTVIAARLGAFGPPPDVVVSGINAGLNTGRSVLHSGTIGAVLTAQNFGVSGLAVSVADSDPWHWETAAELAADVLQLLLEGPARSAINLNVPAVEPGGVLGIRWGRLAPFGAVRAAISSVGNEHLQFELTLTDYVAESDTDQGLVDAGYASITTLVGVTEAWAEDAVIDSVFDADDAPELTERIIPGAPLHAVHQVPDGTILRRPHLGEDPG